MDFPTKRRHKIIAALLAIPAALVLAFFGWAMDYYHAEKEALEMLQSDDLVAVEKTETGWLFDGPSEDKVFIFYPGAKVEETAYAPILHALAGSQMDVYLVKMPLRLAIFKKDAAAEILQDAGYDVYYMGGHSLGGSMAASYAAAHESEIEGVILLAARPTGPTEIPTIMLYGTEDGVATPEKVEASVDYLEGACELYRIEGGNHAQFGNYGVQKSDGLASITAEEQQSIALEEIASFFGE